MGVRLPLQWRWLGDRIDRRASQSFRLHPVLRIGVASLIFLPGVGFLVFGIDSFVKSLSTIAQLPHPVGTPLLALLLAAMGYAFCYVGWRLFRMRKSTDPLLGRRAQLVCACVVASASIGMLREGLVEGHLFLLCNALFAAFWAWWMFYSVLSKRQAQRRALRNPPGLSTFGRSLD